MVCCRWERWCDDDDVAEVLSGAEGEEGLSCEGVAFENRDREAVVASLVEEERLRGAAEEGRADGGSRRGGRMGRGGGEEGCRERVSEGSGAIGRGWRRVWAGCV